jgi:hypothetical protein
MVKRKRKAASNGTSGEGGALKAPSVSRKNGFVPEDDKNDMMIGRLILIVNVSLWINRRYYDVDGRPMRGKGKASSPDG